MISLFLGLGNVGPQYEGTRHNVGFEVLNRVVNKLSRDEQSTPLLQTDFFSWMQVRLDDRQLVFAWPRTLMNRSGLAVAILLDQLGLSPEEMLVIVDDFNLSIGRIRLRSSGGDGGHNGLESIIEETGSRNFPRLRLGIGPAPDTVSTIDFVLGKFQPEEIPVLQEMLDFAAKAVLYVKNNRFEEAMNKFNTNPA
ncbi:MAG: aminoacyl-tRNA hydrolase [candidate division Zixibacteria bacterium]|nr:aminoacyl-tRNA hydrolase [candidate division Zixibacteria bacterium]